MYVNPFWFGVLVTLVIEIVIVFVIAYLNIRYFEEDEDGSTEKRD